MAGSGSRIGRGPIDEHFDMEELRQARLQADRNRGINYRDEVVLRTACGCEKIFAGPPPSPVISVTMERPAMHSGRSTSPMWQGDAKYLIRRFHYIGNRDQNGRMVMDEILPDKDYEHLYKTLHEQVYGMDRGL